MQVRAVRKTLDIMAGSPPKGKSSAAGPLHSSAAPPYYLLDAGARGRVR
jgi:hypothetical protein